MITRRGFTAGFNASFTAGVMLAPAASLGANYSAGNGAGKNLAAQLIGAIQAQMAALPPGPVLLNSYQVQTGPDTSDFDLTQANAAYVYDNALAGLALLASGDTANAMRIGTALSIAQSHDRFWTDGRLRNAYQAGAMASPAKLPGWWDNKTNSWHEDPYQAGTQSGPLAWAMRLWAALGMPAPANRAANWLDDRLRARSGYYGGFYGFEPHPVALNWQSTEQNTDLFTAFSKLNRADDSAHAAGFVRQMFNPTTGLFSTGLSPAGAPNSLLAADAGIWPYLAGLGGEQSAQTAIAGLLQQNSGIGFSAASRSIWLEGTGFAALALQKSNNPALAAHFMATITANIAPNGYVYATIAPSLSTGLAVGPALPNTNTTQPFEYFRRPALAPTAWAAMAALSFNPLSL